MVWSIEDFEREVRRQLVELAALRKRVPPTQEVLERIDGLEASHQCLLRKVREVIQQAQKGPEPQAGAELAATPGSLFQPASSSWGGARMAGKDGQTSLPLVIALEKSKSCFPAVTELCAACGKLLLSDLLAGGEIVQQAPGWYHASCLGGGDGSSERGALN